MQVWWVCQRQRHASGFSSTTVLKLPISNIQLLDLDYQKYVGAFQYQFTNAIGKDKYTVTHAYLSELGHLIRAANKQCQKRGFNVVSVFSANVAANMHQFIQNRFNLWNFGSCISFTCYSSLAECHFKSKHHLYKEEQNLELLCREGQFDQLFKTLSQLKTILPTSFYLTVIKRCIKENAPQHIMQLHQHLMNLRVDLSGILGDYIVLALAKCGDIKSAYQVSITLHSLNVHSCSAMISAYVDSDCPHEALTFYKHIAECGVESNTFTFSSLFRACSKIQDLEQSKRLHTVALEKGIASNLFVGSTLVWMYGKCRSVPEAEDAFTALSQRTIVSWNAMLSAYVDNDKGEKAILLYRQMQHEGVSSDQHTFLYALQACILLAEKECLPRENIICLEIGHALHADARRACITINVFVATALLTLYAKCGAICEAESVFCALSYRDTISWNAMLSACVQSGEPIKCLRMYIQMLYEGISLDHLTPVFALQACGALAEMEEAINVDGQLLKLSSLHIGQAVHGDALIRDIDLGLVANNTIISMYGKCGAVVEAEEIFNTMLECDIISWTAMLSTYIEHDQPEKALWLYKQMRKEQLNLDDLTFVCILQVCSASGDLEMCKNVHFEILSSGLDGISFIQATLIYAYGNCASVPNALSVLDMVPVIDITLWNACIAGHAAEGDYASATSTFQELILIGVNPDEVTFSSVLAACRHTGLVINGLKNFEFIRRTYDAVPNLKHYASILDLLGRAGDLRRVENVLRNVPLKPDLTFWLCLLGVCRTHGNIDLAKQAFENALNLQPKFAIAYVLMANIYADAGLYEYIQEVENSRKQHDAWEFGTYSLE